MLPLRRTARVAGFLYLLVVITGFFTIMYVPGKLFVSGDATAVASNILAHQSLFRVDIAVELLSELLFIATVLMLHQRSCSCRRSSKRSPRSPPRSSSGKWHSRYGC